MDVVAIDFETANGQASSACQLAAVMVRDSQVVAEWSWFIRPPRMYFSPRNIAIHGIRPTDVQHAPSMEQVWSELSGLIDGQVLVAHNARFDIGVLLASLAAHDVACPDLQFTCTRALARAAWPGRERYGLKPLGDWLGIEFQHHDALEDARCCAHIALAIEKLHQQPELAELERCLRVTRGSVRQGLIASPRSLDSRRGSGQGSGARATDRWGFPDRRAKMGSIDAAAVVNAAAAEQPLAGKHIVLLGPLRGLDLQQSHALIVQLGGVAQTHIGAQTDYVIACGTTLDAASQVVCAALAGAPEEELRGGEVVAEEPAAATTAAVTAAAANDTATAVRNAASGDNRSQGIRLLSERQFRALLPAGKATLRW
jgi:DNA polymerase III subunit epsilon